MITGKDLEGSDRGLIEIVSRYLLGETEERHTTPQSGSRYPGRNSNEHLQDKTLKRYRWTDLLGKIIFKLNYWY
jgi:hypothetical protein